MNFKNRKIKVAIVHDFLINYGGAEKVLQSICEMFPEAPIYTLMYDELGAGKFFPEKTVRTSYLQKFPKFLRKRPRLLLPFYLVLPETFDLRDYDLVISSSGAWSKGIITKLNTIHVAYLHSPMRFVWDYNESYLKDRKKHDSLFTRFVFNYLRMWDRVAADRPDVLVANSKYTQRRISKYYRRDSEVIYPPVLSSHEKNEINKTKNEEKNFLVVSRLSAYKKIDVIIEAFNKLELPLTIVGSGEEYSKLRKMAKKNIAFTGWLDEEQLKKEYEKARAFIFAGDDDFGIAPVEAMSYGVPVIAIRKGGIMETVEEGKTGEFFDAQTPEVLADGVRRFRENEIKYDRKYIQAQAHRFSKEKFKEQFENILKEIIH